MAKSMPRRLTNVLPLTSIIHIYFTPLNAIFGVFKPFKSLNVIFGHCMPFLVISCHFWSFYAIFAT